MKIDQETGEVVTVFMRTPYNYNTDKVSDETGLACPPESRTKQEFADEVDINTIVERFGVTGEMPPMTEFPTEQEFEETFDFQTSMNVVIKARETFMTLPAKARARFDNNPQKFMTFMHDEENIDEAIKLGLVIKREKPPEVPKANAPEPVKKEEKKE